jgi:transaldolase
MENNLIKNLVSDLNIEIYLDTADLDVIKKNADEAYIKGFTSNPSLMAKYEIKSYEKFINEFLKISQGKPVSFEVCSDDLKIMYDQAKRISEYGKNIFVKIPYYNTQGLDTVNLINDLTKQNIKVNVTALMTFDQIKKVVDSKNDETETILSIFAGRIADSGRDASLTIKESVNYINSSKKNFKVLWASVREIYNLYEANNCGTHIITITPELISKIKIRNKDLNQYSIETSKMFYEDALKHKIDI